MTPPCFSCSLCCARLPAFHKCCAQSATAAATVRAPVSPSSAALPWKTCCIASRHAQQQEWSEGGGCTWVGAAAASGHIVCRVVACVMLRVGGEGSGGEALLHVEGVAVDIAGDDADVVRQVKRATVQSCSHHVPVPPSSHSSFLRSTHGLCPLAFRPELHEPPQNRQINSALLPVFKTIIAH